MKLKQTEMPVHVERRGAQAIPDAGEVPTLDEIIAFFSRAESKVAILEGMCKFARAHFQSIAFFAVTGGEIALLTGQGPNVRLPKIAGVAPIPIDRVTIVRRCVVNNKPYHGPVPVGEDDKQVFHRFVRELPEEFWLYPACVGEEVDCLVYAERPMGLRELCTDRFTFILSKAILAMRMLYLRKQLASKV